MSTVRMSNDLKNRIHDNAMKAFDSANPEPKAPNDLETLLITAIKDMPLQRLMKQIKTISEEASIKDMESFDVNRVKVETVTLNSLTVTFNERQDPNYHRPQKDRLNINLANPVDVIQYKGHYSGHHSEHLDLKDLKPEHQPQILEKLETLKKRKEANSDKRRDYSNSISNLAEKCNTLKQFLQAWPAAESLVPSYAISRMHEKVTRVQRAKKIREEVSFDDTQVNQVVLTAKLMGGL